MHSNGPPPSFREFILIPETGIPGIPVDPRMGYILGSDTQSGRKSAPKNTHGFSEHFWCSETLKNTKQTRLTHKSDMPLGPKMAPKWHQLDLQLDLQMAPTGPLISKPLKYTTCNSAASLQPWVGIISALANVIFFVRKFIDSQKIKKYPCHVCCNTLKPNLQTIGVHPQLYHLFNRCLQ